MNALLVQLLGGIAPGVVTELDLDAQVLQATLPVPLADLQGIDQFTQLERLSAVGHALQTTTEVGGLPLLHTLNLSHNSINNVGGLCDMPALRSLDLSYNEIVSVAGLAGLTQLTALHLGHNQLRDLEGLFALTKLRSLALSGNTQLTSVDALKEMAVLETLYLKKCPIQDFGPLVGLGGLQALYISINDVQQLAPLAALPALHTLHISGRGLQTLTGLPDLLQVRHLTMSNCPLLNDASALAALPQLTSLNLAYNALSDIDFVQGLPRLQTLDVRGNPVAQYVDTSKWAHIAELHY